MAKKNTARPSSEPSGESPSNADSAEEAGPQVEQSPEVKSAADTVRRVEAELKKAREIYGKVREDAAEQLRKVRETTVGDVIDGTLQTVKRHPGPSVIVAMVIGFFFGRLFRR